jgi:hypothetical protein
MQSCGFHLGAGVVAYNPEAPAVYEQLDRNSLGLTFSLFDQPETDANVLPLQVVDRSDLTSGFIGAVRVCPLRTSFFPLMC